MTLNPPPIALGQFVFGQCRQEPACRPSLFDCPGGEVAPDLFDGGQAGPDAVEGLNIQLPLGLEFDEAHLSGEVRN